MDAFVRKVYLLEIHSQCSFAMNAIAGLESVVRRLSDPDPQKSLVRHQEVFRSIHSFLTHASNVSRLVWPAPPRPKQREDSATHRQRCAADPRLVRGHHLRKCLGLPEHGHALRSRRLRDHLEHFDERLDDWQANSKRHNYMQDSIGSFGSVADVDLRDRMRRFDPKTGCFHFRGEAYNLTKLIAGVIEVQRRAATELRRTQL